jgi:NAD(P)H dehydrogenase (quinone)
VPNDLARAFATVLKRTVLVETVPRESWEQIFRSQGREIRCLGSGCSTASTRWIEFSEHGRSAVKGTTAFESVIAELVRASQAQAST